MPITMAKVSSRAIALFLVFANIKIFLPSFRKFLMRQPDEPGGFRRFSLLALRPALSDGLPFSRFFALFL